MSAVPPSSKSAQSNLGRRIAFAAGRMKVVIRRLAPHAKFSENGNVGHSVSSWITTLNNTHSHYMCCISSHMQASPYASVG